ncbi:hypothetical protein ACWEMU_17185, partial [Streptomyces rubiginosohelvolus]
HGPDPPERPAAAQAPGAGGGGGRGAVRGGGGAWRSPSSRGRTFSEEELAEARGKIFGSVGSSTGADAT